MDACASLAGISSGNKPLYATRPEPGHQGFIRIWRDGSDSNRRLSPRQGDALSLCYRRVKKFPSLRDATRKSLWVVLEFNTVCPTTSDQPSTGNTRPRFVFKLPDGTFGSQPTSELTSRFLAAGSVVSGPERRSVATGRQLLGPAACSATSW